MIVGNVFLCFLSLLWRVYVNVMNQEHADMLICSSSTSSFHHHIKLFGDLSFPVLNIENYTQDQ